MKFRTLMAVALAAAGTFSASVGSASGAELSQKPVLSLDAARYVASAAAGHARGLSAPGAAIAVVDDGGSVIVVERLDGTFRAGPDISIGKARTAAAFNKPTRDFEEIVNKGRTTMVTLPGITHFTPLRGGVPLIIGGQVVGAIGVSGASSADQDDEIAQFGADSLGKLAARSEVHTLSKDSVADAFGKGDTLVSSEEFTVIASRRDARGQAEVHSYDTDIFYVVSGTGVIVTGGTLVEPTNFAPGELRGSSIQGGVEHRLAPGVVMTIPRGTPHWFKTVDAPLRYFAVKATEP